MGFFHWIVTKRFSYISSMNSIYAWYMEKKVSYNVKPISNYKFVFFLNAETLQIYTNFMSFFKSNALYVVLKYFNLIICHLILFVAIYLNFSTNDKSVYGWMEMSVQIESNRELHDCLIFEKKRIKPLGIFLQHE